MWNNIKKSDFINFIPFGCVLNLWVPKLCTLSYLARILTNKKTIEIRATEIKGTQIRAIKFPQIIASSKEQFFIARPVWDLFGWKRTQKSHYCWKFSEMSWPPGSSHRIYNKVINTLLDQTLELWTFGWALPLQRLHLLRKDEYGLCLHSLWWHYLNCVLLSLWYIWLCSPRSLGQLVALEHLLCHMCWWISEQIQIVQWPRALQWWKWLSRSLGRSQLFATTIMCKHLLSKYDYSCTRILSSCFVS